MEGIPKGQNIRTASLVSDSSGTRRNTFGSDVQVRYLVNGQSVKIILPSGNQTFNSDEIAYPDHTDSVQFEKKDDVGNLVASSSIQRPSVGGIPLTYTRLGIFTEYSAPNVFGAFAQFVFGIPTEDADMPRTGSATFQTAMSGVVVAPVPGGGSTGYYSLHDDGATFAADFANMSVTTTLHLVATPTLGATGPDRDFGSLSGTGTIAASGPGFSGIFTTSGVSGGLSGAFFGPDAAEAGFTFNASHADYNVTGFVFGVRPPPP
jgi:hypothetical protein